VSGGGEKWRPVVCDWDVSEIGWRVLNVDLGNGCC
jgi:hypothetical protein